jgi:hypothetical protein
MGPPQRRPNPRRCLRRAMMVEEILVERRTIYAALTVLALAAPAAAQGYQPGYEGGGLPPYEILSILRSTGLAPIGQPMRRGPTYVLRAIDRRDREVRVVISARSGDVLSVTPVEMASRMPPSPRGGVTMGPYERMPPGYVPPDPRGGSRAGLPVDDDDEPGIYNNPNAPRPPGSMSGASPGPVPGALPSRSSNAARSEPPRGGAMQPDDDNDVSPPSVPNVIRADPDRSGMLPPPPERFPQRAAPPAQPKPVKRAAAVPPKQAPLPKPKPAATSEALQPSSPLAAPEPAQQAAPGSDETPH